MDYKTHKHNVIAVHRHQICCSERNIVMVCFCTILSNLTDILLWTSSNVYFFRVHSLRFEFCFCILPAKVRIGLLLKVAFSLSYTFYLLTINCSNAYTWRERVYMVTNMHCGVALFLLVTSIKYYINMYYKYWKEKCTIHAIVTMFININH